MLSERASFTTNWPAECHSGTKHIQRTLIFVHYQPFILYYRVTYHLYVKTMFFVKMIYCLSYTELLGLLRGKLIILRNASDFHWPRQHTTHRVKCLLSTLKTTLFLFSETLHVSHRTLSRYVTSSANKDLIAEQIS